MSALDPDAALAEIREGLRLACCAGDGPLAEAFAALDEHLKHGGRLPLAWQVPPHDFTVHSHPHGEAESGHMGIRHEHPHPHQGQAELYGLCVRCGWSRSVRIEVSGNDTGLVLYCPSCGISE